jgi:hypothetical protein
MSEPDLPIQESELLMILFDYYLFRLVSQQKLQKNRKKIFYLKINPTPNASLASHFYLVYSL